MSELIEVLFPTEPLAMNDVMQRHLKLLFPTTPLFSPKLSQTATEKDTTKKERLQLRSDIHTHNASFN